ncbi:MAG TPA: chromosomal replication initiator protein DnaA [Clostridiales bacterium]|nr:chromosomal replication initiator protein DnaA [Clostridiales bacterium]
MNSLSDIWSAIMEILSRNLTATAINTWFSDCTPVEISDNKLVIHTPSDFKRDIITQRFSSTITSALNDLFSCDFELEVLAGDELEQYKKQREADDCFPEVAGYTFDRFVVGPSNKFAHAAAVAVAENPGTAYNPLFIYGNSGLGKTHLLLAIGQYIHENNPEKKIAYVKGDDFTNLMVRSIKDNTQEEFRQKYRYVDLFLVDDIQFIAGKLGVQEEFFHTFNTLYEAGKQIVITSDRPPMEMSKLEDRLRTRFEGGLMADVQPPDMETRMAITRNKAAQLGLILTDEVVEYIAENITANIRQIEGVVKRLTAYKEILDDTITVNSVKRAIKDVIRIGAYIPTPDVIIEETARYYSLTADDLRGQRRSKNTAMARQVSMYLMRNLTNLSLKDIGEQYEDRNHSTVLNSIRKVEDLLKTDQDMAATLRDISSNINARG